MLDVVHDPFLTRKTAFFTMFIPARTFENTTSQNIGGTNAWAVPHLKLWGDRPPFPLGFRPWHVPAAAVLFMHSEKVNELDFEKVIDRFALQYPHCRNQLTL